MVFVPSYAGHPRWRSRLKSAIRRRQYCTYLWRTTFTADTPVAYWLCLQSHWLGLLVSNFIWTDVSVCPFVRCIGAIEACCLLTVRRRCTWHLQATCNSWRNCRRKQVSRWRTSRSCTEVPACQQPEQFVGLSHQTDASPGHSSTSTVEDGRPRCRRTAGCST